MSWVDEHKFEVYDPNIPNSPGIWWYSYFERPGMHQAVRVIILSSNFFNQQNLNNSLVYINACKSWNFHEAYGAFGNAKLYFGFGEADALAIPWGRTISYYFFKYMMYKYEQPIRIPDPLEKIVTPSPIPKSIPMSAQQSIKILEDIKANPDPRTYAPNEPNYNPNDAQYKDGAGCRLKIDTKNCPNDELYFPAPVVITIEKK